MITMKPVQWITAARKEFETFPQGAQIELARALTVFAEGGHPDIAKPLKGFGSGVLELGAAVPLRRLQDALGPLAWWC